MKKYVILSLFSVFCVLGFKFFLLLKNNNYYKEILEEKTNLYVEGPSAPRGRILDRNGNVLVDNEGIRVIVYHKIKGIRVDDELKIAKSLACILDVSDATRNELVNYYLVTNNNGKDLITSDEYRLYEERKLSGEQIEALKLERITDEMIMYDEETKKIAHLYALMNDGVVYDKKIIKKDVTEEEYAQVLEANIAGVTGEISWKRVYLYDTLRSIYGNIGSIYYEKSREYLAKGYSLEDIVGISYLELQYEDYLKGKKARYKVNSDYTLKLVEEEIQGNDLVLSIDIELQMYIDEVLKKRLLDAKNYGNTEYFKESYALIGNPNTGEVLAIGGLRLNDDGSFSDISINVINKSYTMGSSVKGATIGVGYKYNLIKPGEFIKDSCVKLAHVPSKCSFKSLGYVNDLTALANSSNYYQYMIAIKLTGNNYVPNMKLNASEKHFQIYRDMLSSFGLGIKTEIDLPKEEEGLKGKTISDDLLLNLAIGQYDTYTPIQVLQYINSVATGKRVSLSLMREIKSNKDVILKKEINVLNEVDLDSDDLSRIREGLRLVISEGTGSYYVPKGVSASGKTGTSESFLDTDNDGNVDTATLSSVFSGYFPSDNPKYSLVVITPNISHKNGQTDAFYYGASRITKDIINYLHK